MGADELAEPGTPYMPRCAFGARNKKQLVAAGGVALFFVLLGVCAVAVNICSFALIGKAGPIAYAVVGHSKTIVVVVLGFLFFSQGQSMETQIYNLAGVSVAMVGVILYTHFTMAQKENQTECLVTQTTVHSFTNLMEEM